MPTNSKEYMREYNIKNKATLREKKKQQIANNPEYAASLLRAKKAWRDKNKGYMNEYNKKRKAIDPNFKLRMSLRTRLYQTLISVHGKREMERRKRQIKCGQLKHENGLVA